MPKCQFNKNFGKNSKRKFLDLITNLIITDMCVKWGKISWPNVAKHQDNPIRYELEL